jgi:hypothetical protein
MKMSALYLHLKLWMRCGVFHTVRLTKSGGEFFFLFYVGRLTKSSNGEFSIARFTSITVRTNHNIITIIIIIILLSSNRSSSLLRSLAAIYLEVSLLTVYLWGRSATLILVAWNVTSDLYGAASFFFIAISILLWRSFNFLCY